MTLRQLRAQLTDRLLTHFPRGEADALSRIIFEHLKGWDMTYLLTHPDMEVSDFFVSQVSGIANRLLRDEPIQYITGDVYWHGMNLKVSPSVLIPRPETSVLIDLIADSTHGRQDLRVLDACTGSGCIAIALARTLPYSQVTAFDNSSQALEVARSNDREKHTRVRLLQADALNRLPFEDGTFDLMVSNPPYIVESEKAEMEPNVLAHEPHTALFVPDDHPLLFYTALAHEGMRVTVPGGALWFEINPRFAAPLTEMLGNEGWENVMIHTDTAGRQRFASATRPE